MMESPVRSWPRAIAGVMVVLALSAPAAADPPRRIVSLNLCADQILLDLVPRERIAALTHLAADASVSARADAAAGIPVTRGEAEDVLLLKPDLVLAGHFSTPATVALLERLGHRVVKLDFANDLSGISSTVRAMAAAVGEAPRGEEVVADMTRRLAAAQPRGGGARPTALVYQINGIASDVGSLADGVLEAAGLVNAARQLRLGSGGSLPLESLVVAPPDLLVLTGPADEYRTVVAETLRHPAFQAVVRATETIVLPWRLWLCGTPSVAEAVERLASARQKLEARKVR